MRQFDYLRDKLFLVAVAGYALNRYILKPHLHSAFLRGHFNDLLLIPAALPVLLWIQRATGLRRHDRMPTWPEFLLHWVIWSAICEWLGPMWFHHGTADGWDVVAYAAGGVVACLWWNRPITAARLNRA